MLSTACYHFGMTALKDAREAKGLTQEQLADLAGTSQTQIQRLETGKRKLSKEWAERLAPHLDLTAQELVFGPSTRPKDDPLRSIQNEVRFADVDPPHRSEMRKDLPVLGTAHCSDIGGSEAFEIDDMVDMARRPPALAKVPDAYAIYASGESMVPMFKPGDLVFVHPHKPSGPGDAVVVQCRFHGDHGPLEGFLKILVKRTANSLLLRQLSPDKTIEVPNTNVKALHRVLSTSELFGF